MPLEFQKTCRNWIVDAKEINQNKIPRGHKREGEKLRKRVIAVFSGCQYCVHLHLLYRGEQKKKK